VEIKRAVITAASPQQRTLPLQTLVDRDGGQKTALRILLEEVLAAGIQEVGIVVCPGDQAAYRAAAGGLASHLLFLEQPVPRGYGHAVACARPFTGAHPFLLLVGDHLYVSRTPKTCAQQLVEVAGAEGCSVSAVQATQETKLPYYGAVGGRLADARPGLYKIENVIEKPTPTAAEQKLVVPGLRSGHYLCFFGLHVLTPGAMALLGELVDSAGPEQQIALSTALAALAVRERYLACELGGRRFDVGVKYGLVMGQLALALEGCDRDEVLAGLVELLALRHP